MNEMHVSGISVYPVKSCAPVAMERAVVGPRGLDFDRRWMLVDAGGETLTGREFPALLEVKTEIREGRLILRAPAMPELEVAGPDEGTPRRVFVFEDPCEALGCGARVDQWFRDYLGTECHLVHMGRDCRRAVTAERGGRPGDEVSFADECPLLLTTEASLADLDARAPIEVTMERFRPNLVVRRGVRALRRGPLAPGAHRWHRVRLRAGLPALRLHHHRPGERGPGRAPGAPAHSLHLPPLRRRWPGLRHPPHPARRGSRPRGRPRGGGHARVAGARCRSRAVAGATRPGRVSGY